jgi:hypothetical protein
MEEIQAMFEAANAKVDLPRIPNIPKTAVVSWNRLEVVAHVLTQEERFPATSVSWFKPLSNACSIAHIHHHGAGFQHNIIIAPIPRFMRTKGSDACAWIEHKIPSAL